MEILKHKYDNFKKCYDALGNIIEMQKKLNNIALENPVADDLFRSGVIKHFELAYETAWKFLKQYIADVYHQDLVSPKAVFRACEQYQIFPQQIVNELITLADARNTTTHIYDQVLAREVCNSIVAHHRVFGIILDTIQMPPKVID
jgi:nucleotidyltransferase substrate binding protein (TIGR01987 family)